jgi:iron(III) transport system permease protein
VTLPGDAATLIETGAGSERTRRHLPAHPLLWLAAVAALIPVVIPFLLLVGRAFGGGSTALNTVVSTRTLELVANTTLLVVTVAATAAAIGIGAAWLTERTDLVGRRIWRVLVALPLVLPSYVIALAVISAFGQRGLIADAIGIGLPSLRGYWAAFWALTVATYPFVYLIVAAALRRIDPAVEEAARGLGASPRQVFFSVVTPQLRQAIGAGVLLSALYTLSDFGAVSLAGFDSFTRVVYAQYAGRLDRTPATVLALLLVLLALIVLLAENRIRRGRPFIPRPSNRPLHLSELTPRHHTIATGALGILALVALVLPVGTLVTWFLRDPAPRGIPWGSLGGSTAVSVMAAGAAVILAVPTAMLVVRHRSRRTAWITHTSYLAYSIPHITVGLAMVFLASQYLGSLYQSLFVLVAVYVSVFFALALGSVQSSLSQISPSLEEAARGLGRSSLQTTIRVLIPLMKRGIAAAALLVLLTTMKELPITLLLRPTGLNTLAVDVWSASGELLYSAAAFSALLLLAVSSVPTFYLATRQR